MALMGEMPDAYEYLRRQQYVAQKLIEEAMRNADWVDNVHDAVGEELMEDL